MLSYYPSFLFRSLLTVVYFALYSQATQISQKMNNPKRSAEAINGKNPQAKHAKKEPCPSVILTLNDNKGNFKFMNVNQFKDFEKALKQAVGGSPRETEIMKGGDLLIKPRDAEQAKKFLALNKKKIVNRDILCDYPNSYYSAYRGLISNVPTSFTEKELLDAYSNQGVISVERKKKMEKKNGTEDLVATEQVILTFNCSLPEKVKMIGISSPVSVYYEKPRKCYGKCWRLGHYAGRCHNSPLCKKCGNTQHGSSIPCVRRCINCKRDDHEADEYHKCPAYHEAQEAIYMSVDEGIPIKEAMVFLREERLKNNAEESEESNNNNNLNNRSITNHLFSQVASNATRNEARQDNHTTLSSEVANLKAAVESLSASIPVIRGIANDAISKANEAAEQVKNLEASLNSKLSNTLDDKLKTQTDTLTTSITNSVMSALLQQLAQMNFIGQPAQPVTVIPETQSVDNSASNTGMMLSPGIESIGSPLLGTDALFGNAAINMDIEEAISPDAGKQPLPWSSDSDPEQL